MSNHNTSKSFATFLILCPTTFFLGLLFSQLPYDQPILWTSTPASAATYAEFETHLRRLHGAAAIVPRVLHIVIGVGLLGFFIKLYRPSESNKLFDGASLFLYMCAITVYLVNIVKGLRLVTAGTYGLGPDDAPLEPGETLVSREDSLRVIAASNTILALVLVGVLGLQAGQWYAERKDLQELQQVRKNSTPSSSSFSSSFTSTTNTGHASHHHSNHAPSHRQSGGKKKL